ncbi:MAG: hypothetical protein Q7S44_02865 [bacterium]|nr:hypothetical protein [bacterium]
MNISTLKIPLIRQDPESDDCLRCCALMVFKYFGDSITKDEVWKKLHVYKKRSGILGAFYQDLGLMAIKKGYNPVIYHYDWSWWNNKVAQSSHDSKISLLKALEELDKVKQKWIDKKIIAKDMAYVRKGGQFKFELPQLKTMDFYLSRGVPVILSVKGTALYHDPTEGEPDGDYDHAILAVGKKGKDYLLKDPYLGKDRISAEELYYSWNLSLGWMMVIKPKKGSLGTQDLVLRG